MYIEVTPIENNKIEGLLQLIDEVRPDKLVIPGARTTWMQRRYRWHGALPGAAYEMQYPWEIGSGVP